MTSTTVLPEIEHAHVYLDRTTKFYIASADFFDLDALKAGSNQPDGTGTFRMQVRQIHVVEWTNPRTVDQWIRRLQVDGHRYKPDGELGSPVATAQIKASDLPPAIWVAIREQVPAELHPGGTR